jgi:hypothetical protein
MKKTHDDKTEMSGKFNQATPSELIQLMVYAFDVALNGDVQQMQYMADLIPEATEEYIKLKEGGDFELEHESEAEKDDKPAS